MATELKKKAALIVENFDDAMGKNYYDFMEGEEDEKYYNMGCAACLAAIGAGIVAACNYQSRRNRNDVTMIGQSIIENAVKIGERERWDYFSAFTAEEF